MKTQVWARNDKSIFKREVDIIGVLYSLGIIKVSL